MTQGPDGFHADLLRNPGPRMPRRRPRPVAPVDQAVFFAMVGFVVTVGLVVALVEAAAR